MPALNGGSLQDLLKDWLKNNFSSGSAHSNPRDSEGNEILPAFSPGTTTPLSATVTTTSRINLGTATTVRITSRTAAAAAPEDIIRIAFGNSAIAANATTSMLVRVGIDVLPEIFYVPSGMTHMAYVREINCTLNVDFEITLS